MTAETGRLPYHLRLGDKYWLMAHAGAKALSPRIGVEALQLGCAGALLTELALDDAVQFGETLTCRARGQSTPTGGDYLCAHILNEVYAEPHHDLRTWLEYLATQAVGKLRSRLHTFDVLDEHLVTTGRLRGVTHPAWTLVDSADQVAPVQELHTLFTLPGRVLESTGVLTWGQRQSEVTLAGLVQITGLLRRLSLGEVSTGHASTLVDQWRPRLPATLRTLLATTEVALAERVAPR